MHNGCPRCEQKEPEMAECCDWLTELLDDLLADVPDEEWAKLPPDMAERIDERLYGPESATQSHTQETGENGDG